MIRSVSAGAIGDTYFRRIMHALPRVTKLAPYLPSSDLPELPRTLTFNNRSTPPSASEDSPNFLAGEDK